MKYFDASKYFILLCLLSLSLGNDDANDMPNFDEVASLFPMRYPQKPNWQGSLSWLNKLPKTPATSQDYYVFSPNEDGQSDHIFPYEIDEAEYDIDSEKELETSAPYGIQNVRDVNNLRRTKNTNHGKLTFQSLCSSQRHTVHLNRDNFFEYQPDHYEEVSCLSPFHTAYHRENRNKICGEAGFSCIQLNRTIFLTRRAHGSECWESETRIVMAGCECMWPKHSFGDIAAHH